MTILERFVCQKHRCRIAMGGTIILFRHASNKQDVLNKVVFHNQQTLMQKSGKHF